MVSISEKKCFLRIWWPPLTKNVLIFRSWRSSIICDGCFGHSRQPTIQHIGQARRQFIFENLLKRNINNSIRQLPKYCSHLFSSCAYGVSLIDKRKISLICTYKWDHDQSLLHSTVSIYSQPIECTSNPYHRSFSMLYLQIYMNIIMHAFNYKHGHRIRKQCRKICTKKQSKLLPIYHHEAKTTERNQKLNGKKSMRYLAIFSMCDYRNLVNS